MRKLFVMISLNVAYSTAELMIGPFTGWGTSFFAIAVSRNKPDQVDTCG